MFGAELLTNWDGDEYKSGILRARAGARKGKFDAGIGADAVQIGKDGDVDFNVGPYINVRF